MIIKKRHFHTNNRNYINKRNHFLYRSHYLLSYNKRVKILHIPSFIPSNLNCAPSYTIHSALSSLELLILSSLIKCFDLRDQAYAANNPVVVQ